MGRHRRRSIIIGGKPLTVICYRDGVLAADSLVSCRNGVKLGTARKIARGKSGVLAGASGLNATCEKFLKWATEFDFERFAVGGWPHFPDAPRVEGAFRAVVILPYGSDGKVIEYDYNGDPDTGCTKDFVALGTPYEMAIGAMAAGASAERAVEICIERHADAGGPVKVLRLTEPKTPTTKILRFVDPVLEIHDPEPREIAA